MDGMTFNVRTRDGRIIKGDVRIATMEDVERFEQQEAARRAQLEEEFDDETRVGYLWASCTCGFRGSGMYFVGDSTDLEKAKSKIREGHTAKHPDCQREPTIG